MNVNKYTSKQINNQTNKLIDNCHLRGGPFGLSWWRVRPNVSIPPWPDMNLLATAEGVVWRKRLLSRSEAIKDPPAARRRAPMDDEFRQLGWA